MVSTLIALMLWPMLPARAMIADDGPDRKPTPRQVAVISADDFPSLPGENLTDVGPDWAPTPGHGVKNAKASGGFPTRLGRYWTDVVPENRDTASAWEPGPEEIRKIVAEAVPGARTMEGGAAFGMGPNTYYLFHGTDAQGRRVVVDLATPHPRLRVTTHLDEAEIPPEILAVARRDWPADTAPFDAIHRVTQPDEPMHYRFGHANSQDFHRIAPILDVDAETGRTKPIAAPRHD